MLKVTKKMRMTKNQAKVYFQKENYFRMKKISATTKTGEAIEIGVLRGYSSKEIEFENYKEIIKNLNIPQHLQSMFLYSEMMILENNESFFICDSSGNILYEGSK